VRGYPAALGLVSLWAWNAESGVAPFDPDEKSIILEQIVDQAVPSGGVLLLWLFGMFCLVLAVTFLFPSVRRIFHLAHSVSEDADSQSAASRK